MTDKENEKNKAVSDNNSEYEKSLERKKHITDMYVKNSEFLLKAMFAGSALFIPLLIKIISEVEDNTLLLKISLSLFIVTIIMQVISFHFAMYHCNNSKKEVLRRFIIWFNMFKDAMFCTKI